MKALIDVQATPEQLAIFSRMNMGVSLIRGAAGSGKTTTALLKLRAEVGYHLSRAQRNRRTEPINILVLTFNRTLKGYIEELAREQVGDSISLSIFTFSKWAMDLLVDHPPMISEYEQYGIFYHNAQNLGLPYNFLVEEVSYVLERFPMNELDTYVTARRDGRGTTPRMEQDIRIRLLNEVIRPYIEYKKQRNVYDWNDLAIQLASHKLANYDIVVVDETQDFSANQIRAIMNQVAPEHSVTFIIDSTQKIYQKAFTWRDAGVVINAQNSWLLNNNYRNTIQIARFAAGVIEGITIDDNGCLPNFNNVSRNGSLPKVVKGFFRQQVEFAINFIRNQVDLDSESVAFLHPKGGRWFGFLENQLTINNLDYVTITRESEWPQGIENIALSTLHSAKGLEFDHVFILGLDNETLPVTIDEKGSIDQEELALMRRLIAMGIGRARETVVIGYKNDYESVVTDFFQEGTFETVML